MMTEWTPDRLFVWTWCVAAIGGLAVLLKSKQHLTLRNTTAACLLYGMAGCGLGMVSYEYLNGKMYPWRVIGSGMLVGVQAINWNLIRGAAARMLNLPTGEGDERNPDNAE